MDLYKGTIVIRINSTQKPIGVPVHAHDSWTAKAAIEAQYGGSFVNCWGGQRNYGPVKVYRTIIATDRRRPMRSVIAPESGQLAGADGSLSS